MNLWVKGKGLLAIIMLIVFCASCEEDENTIGLPVENQLDLNYVEYDVPVEMVWTDSVVSQNIGVIYSGKFDLDEAGILKAVPYISFAPQRYDSNINIPSDAVLKDFFIELDYTADLSGVNASQQTLQIYQLADTINGFVIHTIEDEHSLGELIGEKTFTYHPDSLQIDLERDTINYTERIHLDRDLGINLFSKLRTEDSATFYNAKVFDIAFKGLAIVPGIDNSAILGFSPAQTRIIFTYEHLSNGNTVTSQFVFFPTSKFYHNIIPNKDIQALEEAVFSDITCCYEPFNPVGDFVYQVFGTGINIKLDLSAFKMFADTLNNPIVNAAVLELDDVQSTVEHESPPPQISFYLTTSEGKRTTSQISNIDFFRTLPNEQITANPVRVGDPVVLSYNNQQDYYKANITLFINHLIEQPQTPSYLVMESADIVSQLQLPSLRRSAKTLGAISVPKESVKIKMYYSAVD